MSAKQPIIRKGQRKPYTTATHKQIELRTEAAALLIFCGFTKSQSHYVFRERYGTEWLLHTLGSITVFERASDPALVCV